MATPLSDPNPPSAAHETRPYSYEVLLDLGYLARRRGDRAGALAYFEAAIAVEPGQRRPKLEAALELRTLDRPEEAEALYHSVLEEYPNQVRALTGLGRIAQARGHIQRALVYYRAAVAANPARTDLELEIAALLRKSSRQARPTTSGLPPVASAWLARDTFTRAGEWGRNLEALGIPAFGLSVLTLAQDFASGAIEEPREDCILIRREHATKILPLVSDWNTYQAIVRREAAALPSGHLLGYVPEVAPDGTAHGLHLVECHREFVYERASVAGLLGSSLSTYRRQVRRLLKAGARVEPIGPANLDRVLACNDRWFARKKARGRKTYYRGRTLWTLENLSSLEVLGVHHLAVLLDDDVIGYGIASHVGASYAVFTFHRGDHEPWGVAPYVISEMAKLFPSRQWVNDGPAVGKPGLAFFKERFTPRTGERQKTLGWTRV